MIHNAIDFIQKELALIGNLPVKLGNIGEILSDTGNNGGDDKPIIISLINIEENRISRDPQNYVRTGIDIQMKNPAVHLYLTLLFTSVSTGYDQALLDIQHVVAFFQQRNVFENSPELINAGIEKLILEMLSFNLEQLQQLWSMLGGKYHPSIAYRMRMVTIDSVSIEKGKLITEIDANYHHLK